MGSDQNRGQIILDRGIVLQGSPVVLRPIPDDDVFQPDPNRERNGANNSIAVAWAALNGAPGASRTPEGPEGLTEVAGGFYREYAGGRIYTKRQVGTFFVYGAIGERYTELGGPSSWLGWPTSSEENIDGGRVTTFENGSIYWWPDTGAIELGDVVVRYKGLVCFGETDWDQGSDSDEPYVIVGVVPAVPDMEAERTSAVYEDVDDGESREDSIDLYAGRPYGVALTTILMEQDFGNPEQSREAARKGVKAAAKGVKTGVGYVPVIGPILAELAGPLLDDVEPDITDAMNEVLDLRDDRIGVDTLKLTPKQLVTLTRAPEAEFKGVSYRTQSELISGEGASYKSYFDVVPA